MRVIARAPNKVKSRRCKSGQAPYPSRDLRRTQSRVKRVEVSHILCRGSEGVYGHRRSLCMKMLRREQGRRGAMQ